MRPDLSSGTRQDREAWLLQRRSAIGSSDAPAVVLGGLVSNNPEAQKIKGVFRTPFHVYLDKHGLLPSSDDNRKRWGRKLEAVVAEAFVEETGLMVTSGGVASRRHPVYPWMAATPDYLVGHDGLLECKTTAHGGGWGPSGSDEFPEGYLVQVLHQMECLQRSVGYLAVLIGGSDFRWYTIRDQPALRAKIVEIEREFWRAVEDCIPPEPDWTHPETPRLAALLNRPDPAASVQLDSEAQLWAESYERMGREIAGLESERAKCKGRLIDAMGGAGVGVLPDGRKVTRKLQHRKGYSVEATMTEQFRILGKPIHSQDEEMI